MRIGNAAWVCIPGEIFVEYSLEFKRKAPANAFVISLANGELQGYIVTPEEENAGGYEAGLSFFSAASGSRLVSAALSLL